MFLEGNTYINKKTKRKIFIVSVESESDLGTQIMFFWVSEREEMAVPDETLIESSDYENWEELDYGI